MKCYRALLIVIIVPAVALPASAGLFDRRPKVEPAQRVPMLIGQIKIEQDERKRTAAAEELRQYDPRTFPEMVPVLIDALQNDPSAAVRLQAMHSLSSFRPVSQEVGEALEQAQANDKSLRIRLQARTTLVSYRWSGYHSAPKANVAGPVIVSGPKTTEPPLAVPVTAPSPSSVQAPMRISPPVQGAARPLPMPTPTTPPLPDQGPDLAAPF